MSSPASTLATRSDLADRTAAAPRTIAEVVALHAAERPDATAAVFLADDAGESSLTYRELHAAATGLAGRLRRTLAPGDRALLVYPPGLDFLIGFLGCVAAGVLATPTTYPKPRRPLSRTRRIAEDSGARVALSTGATIEAIDLGRQDPALRGLEWIATDTVTPSLEHAPRDVGAKPGNRFGTNAATDVAFLQYTSGSTSEPKGVVVSHANLMANLEAIRLAFGVDHARDAEARGGEGEVGVFWLPAYHDMGLVGALLSPLYCGGQSVLMAPTSYLQDPLRWLRAISEYGAAVSGAPNFAYDYCVRRVARERREGLDLSNWRLAFCGAEPVRAATLRRFAEAFEPCGFNPRAFFPCYGLAEATLLAASPAHDDNPTLLSVARAELAAGRAAVADGSEGQDAVELVGCGAPPAGHRLLVVDP
ncbi:MAG: AMP-binding protein, partial [Lacipirellulaceae bacterium]